MEVTDLMNKSVIDSLTDPITSLFYAMPGWA